MSPGDVGHDRQVERISEGVRDGDRPCPGVEGGLDQIGADIVGGDVDIDEHRSEIVLQNWVDRRREAGGAGDDLVPRPQRPIAEQRARQRRHRQEIGGGPGIACDRPSRAEGAGERSFEGVVEAARRQPEVESRFDQQAHFRLAVDLAGDRDRRAAGLERRLRVGESRVTPDEIQNLRPERVRFQVPFGVGRDQRVGDRHETTIAGNLLHSSI